MEQLSMYFGRGLRGVTRKIFREKTEIPSLLPLNRKS